MARQYDALRRNNSMNVNELRSSLIFAVRVVYLE